MLSTLLRRPQILTQSRSLLHSKTLNMRPVHWKAAAPAAIPGSETFRAQEKLPRLPLPKLEKTLAQLKESLRPIAWSDIEYQDAMKKIDEFALGIGPSLQQRLEQRAKEREHWLEEWWDDIAYLTYRDSVVINVSYYYGFKDHPAHLKQTPAARTAAIARAAMLFRQKLKRGEVKPEALKDGPICMDTYRWMFDCCRIPGEGKDWSVSYAKEGDLGESGHIVIFRKNRVWLVEAAHDGRILSTDELERQIQFIYDNSDEDYPGVGVLTASNRDVWAKDYKLLSANTHNAAIVKEIQSAAFTISLDSASPETSVDFSRALWHGYAANGQAIGLQNRWVDKPCQFIIYDNAKAGIMGEHSVMDGTPIQRMCDDVLDMLDDPSFDHGSGSLHVEPTPLDWKTTPEILAAVNSANKAAFELIDSHDLSHLITTYGKAAIKNFRVSPDSWAQMIIQLAHKRLLGDAKRNGATYEAASTRRFLKGRTEAIRVVSSETDAWAKSMDDPDVTPEERKKLFEAATKKHVQTARLCGMGEGIDRHLLGLKLSVRQGEEVPALSSDPVFQRSSRWILSTSAINSKHFVVYGWGEVLPDGFGVPYTTIYDDRLQYTVTSRKAMPNEMFRNEIEKASEDLYSLFDDETSKSKL